MSKYTTQLRNLIESEYDFGLNEYPIFDENYRNVLNEKIKNHYFFREIGFETAGMFKHYFKSKMNEIMPYYNKLYKSELIEFNPLNNYELTEQYQKNSVNNAESNSSNESGNVTNLSSENTSVNTNESHNTTNINSSNNSQDSSTNNKTNNSSSNNTDTLINKQINSDTPQAQLSINSIDAELYASSASYQNNVNTNSASNNITENSTLNSSSSSTDSSTNKNDNEFSENLKSNLTSENTSNTSSNSTSNSKINSTDDFLKIVKGFNGSNTSEAILKFRETFLNIDMQIINELDELFFQLY